MPKGIKNKEKHRLICANIVKKQPLLFIIIINLPCNVKHLNNFFRTGRKGKKSEQKKLLKKIIKRHKNACKK
jgi:hypothetical protein